MLHQPTSARTGARTVGTLTLTSPNLGEGERIPKRYTADGENISPPLSWSDPPTGTRSLALVCDDPDAPRGIFTHWVVWDIEPSRRWLHEGAPIDGASIGIVQGKNGFGKIGYFGPSPPPGPAHRYVFTLYALDTPLGLPHGASRDEVLTAMDGHVLAQGALTGRYGR